MAEEPQNLVLEHLRAIRRIVDEGRIDLGDLKLGMTNVEGSIGQAISQIGNVQTQIARQTPRLGRTDERIARIERRLDPVEAP